MTPRCPTCGTQASQPDAAFCRQCGGPLRAGAGGNPAGGRLLATWPGGGQSWALDRPELRLGRAPDNEIVIPFPLVSRHHARLQLRPDGYWCVDISNRNGLVLAGQRVLEAPLRPGQAIRIGGGGEQSVTLRYEPGGMPEAAWQPSGQRTPLPSRPRWRIGRDPANDIRLTDDLVSAWHAEVVRAAGGYLLADLGSTNGTYVNQQPIDRQALVPGDVIQVGRTQLRFDGQVLDMGAPQGVTPRSADPPGTQVLRVADHQRQVLIGRDPQADLPLDHPAVSRRHARVVHSDGQHLLEDLGSQNGTFLNGRRIRREALQPGDRIQIGPFRLAYNGADVSVPSVHGGLRLDGVRLVRQVKTKRGLLTILNDVTVSVLPGEFVALVGGSGAGKSTLLKALNGFEPAHGHVMLNGEALYQNFDAFRNDIGYVPQTDIIHRNLPVASALRYVAQLRLPPDMRPDERERRIDEVLALTDIAGQRDKLVSELSGGQLKRVSTAVELLASPRVLYLDEPTSGLDPGLDKLMMHSFRELARDGRTVVLVTHATANIGECDKVAFMGLGGRLVYYGPPDKAVPFFQSHTTPLDDHAIHDFPDIYTTVSNEAAATRWEAIFRKSAEYREFVVDRMRELSAGARPEAPARAPRPRSVGRLRQFGILVRRYLELMVRDQRNLTILLAQAPIIGVLLALAADPNAFESGQRAANLKAQTVVNAMAIVAVWFGISNAAREITKELAIYKRERMANLGIIPYVMSKVAVLSGLCVIQTAILLALVLWRVGLPDEGLIFGPVGDLYVTVLLTSLAGVATGLLLSSMVANEDRAMSMTPIILVPQMLLSGVMFKLSDWKEVLSWATLTYWATHAMGSVVDICGLLEGECREGGRINLDYEHTAEALTKDWAVLAGYVVLFLVFTVLAMRRKDALR